MRPFCPDCRVWMKCEKNDVRVVERSVPIATVRHGDLYACPLCHARAVTGFGKPYSEPADRPAVGDYDVKPTEW